MVYARRRPPPNKRIQSVLLSLSKTPSVLPRFGITPEQPPAPVLVAVLEVAGQLPGAARVGFLKRAHPLGMAELSGYALSLESKVTQQHLLGEPYPVVLVTLSLKLYRVRPLVSALADYLEASPHVERRVPPALVEVMGLDVNVPGVGHQRFQA